MQININKSTVIDADKSGGSFINESGKYIGKLFYAIPVVSSGKGTKGIELGFRSNDGAEASYLRLWLESATGEAIFGMGILQGIMACMKVKTVNQSVGTYEQYDKNSKQMEKVKGECFAELQNKPVGLLLQKVHYTKNDGSPASRMEIVCGFDAQTEQTGGEIMEGKMAEQLAKRIASLVDRHEKPKAQSSAAAEYYSAAGGNGGGAPNFVDPEIPFNCYEKNMY
jgi:single-strand DNA-binding protein